MTADFFKLAMFFREFSVQITGTDSDVSFRRLGILITMYYEVPAFGKFAREIYRMQANLVWQIISHTITQPDVLFSAAVMNFKNDELEPP
jgi:hypothetical protein